MPHLQAYAALWLIIQMALGRERDARCIKTEPPACRKSGLPQVIPPALIKILSFIYVSWKDRSRFFLNINTVILEENESGSAQTTLNSAANKLLCLDWQTSLQNESEPCRLHRMTLMNGHLWCTDTFAADVTGSHAKHICFVGVLQIKVVLLNLAAMFVCFSLDKGDWRSQQDLLFYILQSLLAF